MQPVKALSWLAFLAAAGCASAPPAADALAVARRSIERAEQARAGQAAPTELSQARDKLGAAERASHDHDENMARRLALQADADSRLAEAATVANRSHEAAVQLDRSLQALREESNRAATDSSSNPPPAAPPPPPPSGPAGAPPEMPPAAPADSPAGAPPPSGY